MGVARRTAVRLRGSCGSMGARGQRACQGPCRGVVARRVMRSSGEPGSAPNPPCARGPLDHRYRGARARGRPPPTGRPPGCAPSSGSSPSWPRPRRCAPGSPTCARSTRPSRKHRAHGRCRPLSVAIVEDRKAVLERGYGVREVKGAIRSTRTLPCTPVSNSKAFTVAALAQQVDARKVPRGDRPPSSSIARARLRRSSSALPTTTSASTSGAEAEAVSRTAPPRKAAAR